MDTIQDGVVVIMHYTLKNDQGETLDSSDGGDALPYLHGANNIVPGLEKGLTGKAVGDAVDVAPGAQFLMQGQDNQPIPVWITAVTDDTVTIDANHPLADQTLHFSIKVEGLRAPTDAEKAAGHPAGLTGTETSN